MTFAKVMKFGTGNGLFLNTTSGRLDADVTIVYDETFIITACGRSGSTVTSDCVTSS